MYVIKMSTYSQVMQQEQPPPPPTTTAATRRRRMTTTKTTTTTTKMMMMRFIITAIIVTLISFQLDTTVSLMLSPIHMQDGFNSQFFDERRPPFLERDQLLPKLSGVDLDQIVDDATKKIAKRFDSIEPHIFKNNAMQKPGSIGWFVSASHKGSELAKNFSRSALIAEEATKTLVKRFKLNLDQIVFGLTNLNIQHTSLWNQCPKSVRPLTCYPGKYRSYTGHCNNVEHPDWGSGNMPFARSLAPRYADGVSQPRRSITGQELPSPRDVSLVVHQGHESTYSHMTTVTTFFGKFVFHDLAHIAQSSGFKGQRIKCCGIKKSDLMHPECYPIRVTSNDPFMSKLQQECIEYVRTCPAIRNQCSLGPREQLNQVSSFLDGSPLYGPSKQVAHSLRTFEKGQLKSIRLNKSGKELLPLQESNNPDCKVNGKKRCFKSGDERVNENLGFTIMYTLFMREHNRIARQLAIINPQWNDDELFEETRKIVGAQIQHITYNEFLPYVLGEEVIDRYDLRLLTDGFYTQYNMAVNPSVDNAVANAVFEFLYTTIPSTMERYSKELNMIGSIKMTDSYFNPSEMFSNNKFDEYLMGMVSQNARSSDPFVTDEMTNGLSDDAKEGFDFVAFAIQRGRDHGLPSYTEYRQACKIEPVIKRFDDLTSIVKNDVLKKLSALYKDVRDIDLFTGGLAEKPMKGALVGPTFACLLGRQFHFLRKGDRFWYENDLPPSSFSKEQLSEIRKTSLARILCNNGDRTDFVQPQAMVSSDIFLNAFQYCSTRVIPEMDLEQWRVTPLDQVARMMVSDELINTELARARRDADKVLESEHSLSNELSESQLMHYKTVRAKRQSIAISNQSLVLEKATRGILRKLRQGRDREAGNEIVDDIEDLVLALPKIELSEYLRNQILTQNQIFPDVCDDNMLPCDHTSPFRTITGWCNNLAHPEYGKSYSLFSRFLPPAYEDGISSPRRHSVIKGKSLPSPRLISITVHSDISSPHVRYSLATMQWGQFLDHDITFTPMYLTSSGQLLNCKSCDSRKTVHPECWPIPIPAKDPFFETKNGKKQCLHFVRSMNAQQTLGQREQMNQLTSYLDGSNIYGSDNCEAKKLRLFHLGKLNSTRHPVRGLKDFLPQTKENIECKAPSGLCFLAGDARASEQPSLAVMHTIFMREHNRIAEQLAKINSHWNDERVFQTTRKIISALVQQISFGEFLPRLLGQDYLDRYGLMLLPSGYYTEYDPTCSATIRNEISAAVLRLGHTLLRPSFQRLDVNYKSGKKPIMLRSAFFNSDMLFEPNTVDELLRGLLTSSIETFDNAITEEVTNHLFEERRKPFSGMDLVSLNLQRARDHGLQPYNKYRQLCNLTVAKRFEDLSNEIPVKVIERLKLVYNHVDDIDLFTGGVAETSLHGALVGPTFGCLLGMQFQNLRKCDRFWYENGDKFTRFTEDQLTEIRKIKLSKVICTNADEISLIQKHSMDMPDPFLNPRISCSSLPQIDLTKWKDFEKSCMINNKLIPAGRHRRITPCVNCVCTLEGLLCRSMRINDCRELATQFSREEIMSDQSCVVQCAFALRTNHLRTSPMRTLMSMLIGQNL